jgi:hypothetical protein
VRKYKSKHGHAWFLAALWGPFFCSTGDRKKRD